MKQIIAKWKKTTENKIIWTAYLGSVPFNLYIPKWRIPEPVPEKILIKIFFSSEEVRDKKFISKTDIQLEPQLKRKKIYSDVHKFSEHSQTIRFDPNGESNNWEIGSPYLPKSILKGQDFKELSLVIEWLGLKDLERSGNSSAEEIDDINKITDKTIATNNLISDFELKIREFIEQQLRKLYREDWWNQGIPENIREIAEKRKERKKRIEPKRKYDAIDFLNFWDYNNIILYKKNWNNIFREFFREKYVIQAPFEKLSNI